MNGPPPETRATGAGLAAALVLTPFLAALPPALLSCRSMPLQQNVSPPLGWQDIADLPIPPAAARIPYGQDAFQFGELRLPRGAGPHPVAVILHGGCWLSEYDLQHYGPLSASLAQAGVATWNLEYRRVGNAGGGWPGTFQDVAQGVDFVRTLAKTYPLDATRVVLVGHSAGGHLALWLAARPKLPKESPLFSENPLPIRGVVSLAGIVDLRAYAAGTGSCNAATPRLLGGLPAEVPNRYAQASPAELLPLGVSQRLIHGTLDSIVPLQHVRVFHQHARDAGDDTQLQVLEGQGHFDLIAPTSPAYAEVEKAVHSLLARP